jgi:hypothetical protein
MAELKRSLKELELGLRVNTTLTFVLSWQKFVEGFYVECLYMQYKLVVTL